MHEMGKSFRGYEEFMFGAHSRLRLCLRFVRYRTEAGETGPYGRRLHPRKTGLIRATTPCPLAPDRVARRTGPSASRTRASEAVSIRSCNSAWNASRGRPGGITGRNSITAVPGR